jgi:tetratricopeptide (TPR) repeat protein
MSSSAPYDTPFVVFRIRYEYLVVMSPKKALAPPKVLTPSERPFVGRDDLIDLFKKNLTGKKPDEHKVLVFYGVAGIGKSRLRQELTKEFKRMKSTAITMTIDFFGSRYRTAEDGLPFIRWTLKREYNIPFPTFDIAFALYWQKSKPHIPLTKETFPLWDETSLLGSLIETFGEIPGVDLIPKVGKVIIKAPKLVQDLWKKHSEPLLRGLSGMEAKDIEERLSACLAIDIRNHLQQERLPRPLVIFFDTYEELTKDDWVRNLVAELPEVLWIITGRERLRWAETDGEWENRLDQHEIFGLEKDHARKFLEECGVESQEIREVILKQSLEDQDKYFPFHLNVYLDIYDNILRKGKEPTANDLNVPPHEFYKLFTRHLDKDEVEAFKALSAPRWWDDELVRLLFDKFGVKYHLTALPELYRFSFIKPGPRPRTLTMHDRMRDCLQNWLKGSKDYQQLWEDLHRFLFGHYQTQLDGIGLKDISDQHKTALGEAFYHASQTMEAEKLADWVFDAVRVFEDAAQSSVVIPIYLDTIALLEETLGEDNPTVATALNNLALLYKTTGRYAEAEPLFKRALKICEKALPEGHPDIGKSLNNLAALYRATGRYAEAEPLYQRALEIGEKALGKDHPDVATWLNNLAGLYQSQSRYAEAEPLYKRVIEIFEKALGKEHPNVATSLNNLAGLYQATGRYAEAEPLYKRALEIGEKTLGKEHPAIATCLNNLAELYRATGRYAEAEPLYQRALAIDEKALGKDHPGVATDLNNLAGLYDATGRYAEAEPLCQRALAIDEKALGKDHPDVATRLNNLALLYDAQGRYAEAEPLYKRALAIDEKALGKDHPGVATDLNNLAELYRATGRYAEAAPLYKRALEILEKALPPDHPDLATVLENVAIFYRKIGKDKEAEKLEERAREIREKRRVAPTNSFGGGTLAADVDPDILCRDRPQHPHPACRHPSPSEGEGQG